MKRIFSILLLLCFVLIVRAQVVGEDPDWFVKRNVEPIEPLLTTRWGQYYPFNKLLERKSGICTLVAFCQILHYFRVPQTCKEVVKDDKVILPITTFDHDKIVDCYYGVIYTDEQADEVAKLFYYYYNIDFDGISEYLNMHSEYISSSATSDFYERYDYYLERGIPIWACGKNHAFVIDGRDSEGRYHINLGWNGNGNGYYALPRNYSDRVASEKNPQGNKYTSVVSGGYVIIPNWDWQATNVISVKEANKVSSKGYYNLNGQFMGNTTERLAKGIYIKDGKKVFIK